MFSCIFFHNINFPQKQTEPGNRHYTGSPADSQTDFVELTT